MKIIPNCGGEAKKRGILPERQFRKMGYIDRLKKDI